MVVVVIVVDVMVVVVVVIEVAVLKLRTILCVIFGRRGRTRGFAGKGGGLYGIFNGVGVKGPIFAQGRCKGGHSGGSSRAFLGRFRNGVKGSYGSCDCSCSGCGSGGRGRDCGNNTVCCGSLAGM